VIDLLSIFLWLASSSFESVATIHCLAALDLGAGIEQSFNCLIIQNRQAVQSMRRWMDRTLEDNMVDGLFFCATFTGRRMGHTPFMQAGKGTYDTGAEAVEYDPRCSWQGHSRRVGSGVRDYSTESCGVVQPLRIPSVKECNEGAEESTIPQAPNHYGDAE